MIVVGWLSLRRQKQLCYYYRLNYYMHATMQVSPQIEFKFIIPHVTGPGVLWGGGKPLIDFKTLNDNR